MAAAGARSLFSGQYSPRILATIGVAVWAICSKTFLFDFSPLAKGKIPAAARSPHEHWKKMANDITFVRQMTEPLRYRTNASSKVAKKMIMDTVVRDGLERIDTGGPDGHIAEASDFMDLEEIKVTRCSTTRSAVTAYMVS